MSNGMIDIDLTDETVTEVMSLIDQIEAKLPFLKKLEVNKNQLVTPHPTTPQVAEGVVEVQQAAGYAPPDPDPMTNDLSVYRGLSKLEDRLVPLLGKIRDIRYLGGSECWNEALVRYGVLRQMARSKPDLEPMLDRLRPLISSRHRRAAKPSGDE